MTQAQYSELLNRIVFLTPQQGAYHFNCAVCKTDFWSTKESGITTCQNLECIRKRAVLCNKQYRAEKKAAKDAEKAKTLDKIQCPHCKELFLPKSARQYVCSKENCQRIQDNLRRAKNRAKHKAAAAQPEPTQVQVTPPPSVPYEYTIDFDEMQTYIPEFPNWNCAENDPLTNRDAHDGIWFLEKRTQRPNLQNTVRAA